ncbi:nucleotidyltransferase domain-containing protein [Candidatus Woesearchaeota archaeon]|nr:nucleotidyltransferase domain-containing protein [Candidatus Woesearchaeota archaeon]
MEKTAFDRLLRQHRPSSSEEATVFLAQVNAALAKQHLDAAAMLGGSVAKGTHLSLYDCDIFVIFARTYATTDISSLLQKALLPFKPRKVHGSRDYFQIARKGITFELIPVLHIDAPAEAQNVTDVSPLHVTWVRDNIGQLHDDVRLAKLFCKAQGVYGAESYINGFSGYILEVLVIAYKGFIPMLRAAASFRQKQLVDVMHYYKSRDDVFKRMNAAKIQSPLIVIDPVQADRNAAAAVSDETFARFVLAAKLFMQKPSLSFFKPKPFSLSSLKVRARQSNAVLLQFSIVPHDGKGDVVGSKLVKCFDYMAAQLKTAEFMVLDKGWHWNDIVIFWYLVYPSVLPAVQRHDGPQVYASVSHIVAFTQKHKSFIVENDKVIALRPRKYRTLAAWSQDIVRDAFVRERVQKIKVVT